jgi:NitT/TauT family transport system substrate-binding protein
MNKKNQGQAIDQYGAPPGSVSTAAPQRVNTGRRAWLLGMLASGSAAAIAAPGVLSIANTKLEKKQISIAAPSRATLPYLPLTVAEQLGFFTAEGLEVEVVEPASLVRAQQMASGAGGADIVCGWIENTLALQAKGQAFQAFVLLGRAPQVALGVSTKTMPNYTHWGDLRGKRVGIPAPGTPNHTIACTVLARAGLRLAEMSFVSVGTPAGALAALRAGQVDALSYMDPLITQLEQRSELRVLADTRTVRGTLAACGGEMPAACLYATPDFLQKYPESAQAVTHAIVRALKWLQTAGLSDLMKIVPDSYFASDRALYLASYERMHEAIALDGLIPPAGVRNTLAAMRSAEPLLRMETINPDKSFTNVFAQKAKLRFKA